MIHQPSLGGYIQGVSSDLEIQAEQTRVEILHAARLLPFRKRSDLAPEEVDALFAATGSTLASAVEVLRRRVPPTFEKQVRDFLAVHDKGGTPCPRCGTKITEVKPGGFVTSYCRGCQR